MNSPRYIHQYRRLQTSKYVPQTDCPTALPQWKRIDALQDALPERDKGIADKLGETITPEQYAERLSKGGVIKSAGIS